MDIVIDPIDEELNQFERDMRQLKIEYEQYFGGGRKRPPTEIEWKMELIIKRHGDRAAAMSYGQRFRYHNLSQTYAKYREMFHKRMRKREEGGAERHYGAAARAIESMRAARTTQPQAFASVTCTDPIGEPKKVEQLYTAFREALERSGESTGRLTREQFEQFLRQKSEQLHKQQNGRPVEYVVSVEDGKARLKVRVRS